MQYFLFVFFNNIVPIFFIICIGYIMGLFLNLEIQTLSKINFFAFIPAMVLVNIYETAIDLNMLYSIIFGILLVLFLAIIGYITTKITNFSEPVNNAFMNSFLFYNAGNYSLPLIVLVFNNSPFAISIQVMILLVQTITLNTLAFYFSGIGDMDFRQILGKIIKIPPIYAVIVAIIWKAPLFDFEVKDLFIWPAIDFLNQGFIPVALLTLGVQLSQANLYFKSFKVYFASFFRLIIGPLVAFLLIIMLNIEGVMAQVLLISSAAPTALLTALIAIEFDNEADFASQVVLTTTLLSTITVPIVIIIALNIF